VSVAGETAQALAAFAAAIGALPFLNRQAERAGI